MRILFRDVGLPRKEAHASQRALVLTSLQMKFRKVAIWSAACRTDAQGVAPVKVQHHVVKLPPKIGIRLDLGDGEGT